MLVFEINFPMLENDDSHWNIIGKLFLFSNLEISKLLFQPWDILILFGKLLEE